jgi:hypothetical protein
MMHKDHEVCTTVDPVDENHEVYVSGQAAYTKMMVVGTYMVQWYRQGNKLGVRIYHDDPAMLEKVAAKKGLTLVGEIERQESGMVREMRCTVAQWSSSCVIRLPEGYSLQMTSVPQRCDHEWETVLLFSSFYQKCTKCGEEQ